jgi:pimeloyl-ACP methyl ester carboxylesterase
LAQPSPRLALLALLVGVACSHRNGATPQAESTVTPMPSSPLEGKARTFVDELAHGDWAHSRTPFDDAMSSAMPAPKLREVWEKLEAAGGPFRSVEATRVETKEPFEIVLVTCKFDRLRKVLRVVLDRQSKLAGLFYGPVPAEVEAKTRSLLTAASRGDFELASRDFGDGMRNALPPRKFAETWKTIEETAGRWQSVEGVELKPEHGVWSSRATSRFERDRLVVVVNYDAKDQIVGLFAVPPPVAWTAPPYANTDAFEEHPVTVGDAPPLPGVLAMPKGGGPFPAVVLVHGSGPNDEDESVGAIKVFTDLGWGLASRGIAVLRYVKRSRQAPAGIVTQKEEVLDAAHEAIELLRRTPAVDPARVFLLGHSQGGGLAPRIAKENPTLAGMIVLAGPTRPLQDVILEQYTYLSSLNPENNELSTKIDAAKSFKRTVEDPRLSADQVVELPTGGTLKGAYFLDVRGYDPPQVARTLSCRMLVLQGERDYQVTMKDFAGWRRALLGKEGAVLRTYPSCNHLFVSGVGAPTPSEYERPGHVDDRVVDDIARWVAGGRS